MTLINNITLNNQFLKALSADKILTNNPRQVLEASYSYVRPEMPLNPKLIHLSDDMIKDLGLENDKMSLLSILSGEKIIKDSQPYAMCYGGHQFGNWAGQLGDGRAINLGEIKGLSQNWALQLKGAGPTPYSRSADGLAVLRSSIREYLCSEAMFHLNVPTTRALSLALSGKKVLRDVLYNGNPAYESGAIVCRVAESFVRFGSFEIFAARGDHKNLKKITDYVISEFYPEIKNNNKIGYLDFFQAVCERTKEMILAWQKVGFVHGVMNTDNMSILGLTIDYGPYGWLENYDEGWTPNTTDAQYKRYRFGNQSSVALWNLTQLANALYPLIEDAEALTDILKDFKDTYQPAHLAMQLEKIGVYKIGELDEKLIKQLLKNLYASEIDMTMFYRELSTFDINKPLKFIEIIKSVSYASDSMFEKEQIHWELWLYDYASRLKKESLNAEDRMVRMNAFNPKYVLRNYMAQLAIDAAEKEDYSVLEELFNLLKNPFDEQPKMEKWYAKRPDWAKERVGCSMLSCSS